MMHIGLFDLLTPLARMMDYMNPALANHHLQVAYIAYHLALELGLEEEEVANITAAGLLHDIGAFELKERLKVLNFELEKEYHHAHSGAALLASFSPLHDVAVIVKHHHNPWEAGAGTTFNGEAVPRGSHILHLADRAAVLIPKEKYVLSYVPGMMQKLREREGDLFMPELVDAMESLSKKDFIWMNLATAQLDDELRRSFRDSGRALDQQGVRDFALLMCRVIDFKSSFTATHTSGIAATSVFLARLYDFAEEECVKMEIAACLHDIGKLAIPSEIVEKPGKLTDDEWHIMRSHAYFTYHMLDNVEGLDTVREWSMLHQERLNGTGYPFGRGGAQLSIGARILAVADVFTGITEDRPYRAGMPKARAMAVLDEMVLQNALDGKVVALLKDNYDALNILRIEAQKNALQDYAHYQEAVGY